MRRKGKKITSSGTLEIQTSASAPHACRKKSVNPIKSSLCCSPKKETKKKSHDPSEHRYHVLSEGDVHKRIRKKLSTSEKSCDHHESKHPVSKRNFTKSDVKIDESNGCARTRIFPASKKSNISEQSRVNKFPTINDNPSEINDAKFDLKTIADDKKLQTSCTRSDDKNKTRTLSYRCKKRARLQKGNEQALCCAMTRYIKRILLTTKNNDEKKKSLKQNKVASACQSSKTSGYDSSNNDNASANLRPTRRIICREITTQTERDFITRDNAAQTTSPSRFDAAAQTVDKAKQTMHTQTVGKAKQTMHTQTVETLVAEIGTQTNAEDHFWSCGAALNVRVRNNDDIDDIIQDSELKSRCNYLVHCPSPSALPKPISLLVSQYRVNYCPPPPASELPLPTTLLWKNTSHLSNLTSRTSSFVPLSWLESDEPDPSITALDISLQCNKTQEKNVGQAREVKWARYMSHTFFRVFARRRDRGHSSVHN